MNFGTKAETLSRLEGRLTYAVVLPQICFTVKQWRASGCMSVINEAPEWLSGSVVVRSSSQYEDTHSESLAGHFTSILNVSGQEQLLDAIGKVVSSFGDESDNDQILIQPMLKNVKVSGVAFSRDPGTGSYYYTVNYDDHSGKTDTVTEGSTNDLTVFYFAKGQPIPEKDWIGILLLQMKELEDWFQNDSLDVEFAIGSDDQLIILQLRPLIINQTPGITPEEQSKILQSIEKRICSLSKPHPYLLGERTIFGVMPDWNPAEIIGIRPRPLALSLYKEIVTDNIWAYQRDNYGYRNLRSFPLLIKFSGLPFIDVRVSFNSFIPGDLNGDLAERLVNYYIDYLAKNPENHDKVEFEIIYSCYTLNLPERLAVLLENGFNRDEITEITESLRKLTNTIIKDEDGLWRKDISKIEKLCHRQKTISDSSLPPVDKIYWLLEDCKRYGTLPFAGLARAGFIAVQLLRSLISVGILTEDDYEYFLRSLDTVGSKMSRDLIRLNRDNFLEKYGHLRPGTYDILSPRYDEIPDNYFDWDKDQKKQPETDDQPFSLGLSALNRLKKLLKTHRIEHDAISFLNFIKGAIEGREYAKFIFTKSLSDVLLLLTELGEEIGIPTEDMSYADIDVIRKLYGSNESISDIFTHSIDEGKKSYVRTSAINLPDLIVDPHDIWAFNLPKNEPNYITLGSISSKVVDENVSKSEFSGNIILISSADPGYDWIFSHNIGGFITMYGGTNSHMAIRAGELGIPAVIGAGKSLFQKWSKAELLHIDCANKQVRVLK